LLSITILVLTGSRPLNFVCVFLKGVKPDLII